MNWVESTAENPDCSFIVWPPWHPLRSRRCPAPERQPEDDLGRYLPGVGIRLPLGRPIRVVGRFQ